MLSHSIAPRLRQRLMIEKSAQKAMYRYVLWRVNFQVSKPDCVQILKKCIGTA